MEKLSFNSYDSTCFPVWDITQAYEPETLLEFTQEERPKSTMSSWILGLGGFFLGLFMQMMAQQNIGPVLFVIPVFLLGLVPVTIPFLSDRWSRRAYVLTFGMVIFIGGLYQVYQNNVIGMGLFSDENTFYGYASVGLGGTYDWRNEGYWIPLLIWRFFYSVSNAIGTGNGPWIGPVVNALMVAWSAAILLRTAKYIFGPDDSRLRRLGTFFAASGIFWLYGACFLRDCFALILQVITLWALVRCLCLINIKNIVIAALAILFCVVMMQGIRGRTLPMFMAFVALAAFSWTRRKGTSVGSLVLILFGGLVLVVVAKLVLAYFGSAVQDVLSSAEGRGYGQDIEGGNSLTKSFVMSQPLPIRMIAGSLLLLIYPIPLWTHFFIGAPGYVWMKGLHGCLMVLIIVPLLCVGIWRCFIVAIKGGREGVVAFFLMSYAILTLMALAASAIDTRYLGQFLPVIFILAVIPDWRDPITRSKIVTVGTIWYSIVFLGHSFWLVLKLF